MRDCGFIAHVCVPVSDLRGERVPASLSWEKDHLQETQLLRGEEVEVLKEEEGWSFIRALEQVTLYGDQFLPYEGWVQSSDVCKGTFQGRRNAVLVNESMSLENGQILSLGTYVDSGLDHSHTRDLSIQKEKSWESLIQESLFPLLGTPYLWGGRSAYIGSAYRRGVDCSGLVLLMFQLKGIRVPRNAHDQFVGSRPLRFQDLVCGDLIFLKPESRDRVDHVMIYLNETELLEATVRSGNVRIISLEQRLSEVRDLGMEVMCGRLFETK